MSAYDEQYLYFAFRCEAPNARGIKTLFGPKDRDGIIFRDESVEMFFDVEHSHERYYQIIPTIGGAIFDDVGQNVVSESVDATASPPRLAEKSTRSIDDRWTSSVEFATAREEDAWTVEGRVPLKDFGVAAIREGEVWGFNLCRDEKATLAQSTWSPLPIADFHVPRFFGHLVFGRPVVTISDVDWDVGRGKAVLRAKARLEGAGQGSVKLNLTLDSKGGAAELGAVEAALPAGQTVAVELPYVMPEAIESGKLVLSASRDGNPVCRRAHYFAVPPVVEIGLPNKVITTSALLTGRSCEYKQRVHAAASLTC
jgi:hypothetical protein